MYVFGDRDRDRDMEYHFVNLVRVRCISSAMMDLMLLGRIVHSSRKLDEGLLWRLYTTGVLVYIGLWL